jgi:glycosyltransferase involved in cell wall biosynthesis
LFINESELENVSDCEGYMAAIKIAYILTPITFGGAEKVSLNFLKTVDRACFDVTLVLLLRPWEEPPLFAQEIVTLGYDYITLPVSIKKGGDPFRVLRVAWRIFKLLKTGKFDIVHTHGYFADICAIPLARLLGIKTITTCHGFITNDAKLKLYNKLNVYAIKLCHRIIAVSEGIRDQLIFAGASLHKISVVPNAVETAYDVAEIASLRDSKRRELQIHDGEFVVGFLGRLSAEKGVNFLIDAVALLVNEGLPIRLLPVGDGAERDKLEEQGNGKCSSEKVIFVGFQSDTQSWLAAFDMFVLPSLTEGTPMALLEAMAMGVPVVASRVGGVPKVIENDFNGLLISPASVEELKDKIIALHESKSLRKKLVESAFLVVSERYSIESWYRKIAYIYVS